MKNIISAILCTMLFTVSSMVLTKDITLFVHGTNPPGVDIKRKLFGGYIPKNLTCATDLTDTNHPHDIVSALCAGNYQLTPKDRLYFFGWDGFFPIQREQEAQRLYDELMQFIKKNNITQDNPLHVRFVTHSHGGNVALCLLNLIDTNKAPIVVDELILMGCPIQKVTENYAHAQCVKKIYNFYSLGDEIQTIDPQGWYPETYKDITLNAVRFIRLFSERTFNKDQDNLWQIEATLNGEQLGHMDFVSPLFLGSLQQVIEEIKTHDAGKICINAVTNDKKPIEHINLKVKK